MKDRKTAHNEIGLKSFLSTPQFFNFFTGLVGKKSSMGRFVRNVIKPFPGCRILDIGCGTGNVVSYLPDSIGEYNGFDMNRSYIEYCKKRWGGNSKYRFFCEKVSEAVTEKGVYDIVLAMGILHHLTDSEAGDLFNVANGALKKDGVLITYDNVYIKNQHWFAKWFISKDRGQAVRTVDGYKRLAELYFKGIEGHVLHDTLRLPYTIFVMRCIKSNIT